MIITISIILFSYLLGAIPFGFLISKWGLGIDIRKEGSGNIGATNVLRSGGKKEAALTLLADALKGFLPVFAALTLTGDPRTAAISGVVAVVGHIFPVFLRFKGGKGVATALGVLVFLLPKATLAAIFIFAATAYLSKYVSLGSITAATAIPLLGVYFHANTFFIYAATVISLLVIIRHHENIRRLLGGKENRLGDQGK